MVLKFTQTKHLGSMKFHYNHSQLRLIIFFIIFVSLSEGESSHDYDYISRICQDNIGDDIVDGWNSTCENECSTKPILLTAWFLYCISLILLIYEDALRKIVMSYHYLRQSNVHNIIIQYRYGKIGGLL